MEALIGTSELIGIAGASPSGINPNDLTVFNNEVLFSGQELERRLRAVGNKRNGNRYDGNRPERLIPRRGRFKQ